MKKSITIGLFFGSFCIFLLASNMPSIAMRLIAVGEIPGGYIIPADTMLWLTCSTGALLLAATLIYMIIPEVKKHSPGSHLPKRRYSVIQ